MYRDGNIIKIDELFNDSTTDPDGLEVMVYIKSGDIEDFLNAIRTQLIYFENLYITADRYIENRPSWTRKTDLKQFINIFNNLKIKRYTHFSVNTCGSNVEPTICLGKIQYPLNKHSLTATKFAFDNQYPIAINFEIGDLEVTPNREQILYSKNNVEKIVKKLDAVQDELDMIIQAQSNNVFTDFTEYIQALRDYKKQIILLKDNDTIISFTHKLSHTNINYKGMTFTRDVLKLYESVYQIDLFENKISFYIQGGKIYTKSSLNVYTVNLNYLTNVYSLNNSSSRYFGKNYICDISKLSNIAKDYLRSLYPSSEKCIGVKPFTKKQIAKTIFNYFKSNHFKTYHNYYVDRRALKILIYEIFKYLDKIPTFDNSDVPQKFIDDRNAELALLRKNSTSSTPKINYNEELNLFVLRRSDRYSGDLNITSDSRRISLQKLKNCEVFKNPVIYSVKDNLHLRALCQIFNEMRDSSYRKYTFIEIAPTKIHLLANLPNFIRFENFMDVKYSRIRRIATAKYINDTYPYLETLYNCRSDLKKISIPLSECINRTYNYIRDNTSDTYYYNHSVLIKEVQTEIYELCKNHNYYDEEMLGYVNQNKKMLTNARFITLCTTDSGKLNNKIINFIVQHILSNKLFKLNPESVKKLKKETIYNIEKNENN